MSAAWAEELAWGQDGLLPAIAQDAETGEVLWLSFYFQGSGKPGVELGRAEYEQLRDGFARAVLTAARQIEMGETAAFDAS